MRLSTVFLTFLLLWSFWGSFGVAQSGGTGNLERESLSYADALTAALQTSAAVNTAQVDLASAERDLGRLKADPLALRIPLLQAEQALTRAQQSLRGAEADARAAVAEAYANALEARSNVALAEKRLAIARTRAEATQIRFEAGAATSLDVADARNVLQSAQRDLGDAQEARTLAYDRLASLLALPGEPSLSDAVPVGAVPTLEDALAELDANSALVAARQGLELAQAQLAAVDNAFSARSDVEAARDAVVNAETQLRETRRSLELGVQQSYNAVVAAQNRAQGAADDLAAAQETLQAQRVRFQAGSISQLELAQSELNVQGAAATLETAQHALAASLRALATTLRGGSR